MLPADSFRILAAWAVLGLLLIGIGGLVRRACRCPAEGASGLLLSFWIGWACLVFALQIWHLFLPVDERFLPALIVAGMAGLVLEGPRPWLAMARSLRNKWPPILALLSIALWLANRALAGPLHGDTGAYFIPNMRWAAAYPIVPGLANLYFLFGLNQSYFLYAASLDVGPFDHRSFHVVNGIFVLVLFAHVLLGLDRTVRRTPSRSPEDVFYALFLPAAVGLAFGIFLTSPSPDLSVFVLSIVISGRLIDLLSRPAPRPAPDFDVVAIALLAVLGPTVKLTFAGMAAALLPIALLVWLIRDRPGLASGARTLAAVGLIGGVGMGTWIVRSIILSGCPFYPSHLGALSVEWRVASSAVEAIVSPVSAGFGDVVRDPLWGAKRLESIGWGEPDVVVPLAIAAAAGLLALVLRMVRLVRRSRTPCLPAFILLPPIATLAVGFATSPLARYMGATFWLLAAETVLLALGSAVFGGKPWPVLTACGASLALACLPFFDEKDLLSGMNEFQGFSTPETREVHLPSGLVVRVPAIACFDAPLPCTPEPNPALQLRRDGDLASGFKLDSPR